VYGVGAAVSISNCVRQCKRRAVLYKETAVNKSAVKSRVTQQLELFALRSLELGDQPIRYPPGEVLQWAQSRLSAPIRSTGELDAR
jgi:hypothetical protein